MCGGVLEAEIGKLPFSAAVLEIGPQGAERWPRPKGRGARAGVLLIMFLNSCLQRLKSDPSGFEAFLP